MDIALFLRSLEAAQARDHTFSRRTSAERAMVLTEIDRRVGVCNGYFEAVRDGVLLDGVPNIVLGGLHMLKHPIDTMKP